MAREEKSTFLSNHFHQYLDLKTSIEKLADLIQNVLRDELSQSFVKQELHLKIETGVKSSDEWRLIFARTKCNFIGLCCYLKVFFCL
jgi:hypothetical protein